MLLPLLVKTLHCGTPQFKSPLGGGAGKGAEGGVGAVASPPGL
jgi:hypothetical protein